MIGVAALAMIGIVLHGRSDSTPAAATSAPPPSVAAPLVPAITERKPPELSPVETVTEAPPPAAPAKVAPVASEKVTTAHKPSPAAHEPKGGALAAVPRTSLAKTPAATSANPGARPAVSTTSQRAPVLPDGDDDLVRLQRAAADRVTEANARGLASSVPSATENAPPPPLPPAP